MVSTLTVVASAAAFMLGTASTACTPPVPATPKTEPRVASQVQREPEATSLLGKPLFAPAIPDARRGQLEADLAIAKHGYDLNPKGEGEAVLYGRRLAALGRFRESISVFTAALEANPESYRLLRHRGHRYLTTRRFELAVQDLGHAWELAAAHPDQPEPDLDAKRGMGATGTDRSNILFHLGLAHYFRGEFQAAADVLAKRTDLESGGVVSNDTRISLMNWQFLSLMRAGHAEQAKAVLAGIEPGFDTRNSDAYVSLVHVYRGEVAPDVLTPGAQTGLSTNLAMVYGVAAWKRLSGDATGAKALLDTLAANGAWPSFGVIAAEADLAKGQTAGVETGR